MCYVRFHGKECYYHRCQGAISINDYVTKIGPDGKIHSYHRSCAEKEEAEMANRRKVRFVEGLPVQVVPA